MKKERTLKGIVSLVVVVLTYLIFGHLLSGCSALEFRTSPERSLEIFGNQEYKPTFKVFEVGERKIHYAEIGPEDAPMIVFIHGSPGSLDNFYGFFKKKQLYENFRLISVDRPGFGYSDFGFGVDNLSDKVDMLAPLLDLNQSKVRPLLVGHSLGGPIIAKMAIDYPEKVGGLLYLAASVSPDLEPSNWYRYILEFPVINYLLPTAFAVSNTEILPLKKQLKQIEPQWMEITVPAWVIHGTKDRLVPVGNAAYIKEMTINAEVDVLLIENEDHFLPWSQDVLIEEKMLQLMQELQNQ